MGDLEGGRKKVSREQGGGKGQVRRQEGKRTNSKSAMTRVRLGATFLRCSLRRKANRSVWVHLKPEKKEQGGIEGQERARIETSARGLHKKAASAQK